jgi:hypothetical protein
MRRFGTGGAQIGFAVLIGTFLILVVYFRLVGDPVNGLSPGESSTVAICDESALAQQIAALEGVDAEGVLELPVSLIGPHHFWTRVEDGTLDIVFVKRDLNASEGPDYFSVNVFGGASVVTLDRDWTILGTHTIDDDGDRSSQGILGAPQSGRLFMEDLPPGDYMVIIGGSLDWVVTQITVNQPFFVAEVEVNISGQGRATAPPPIYAKGGDARLLFRTLDDVPSQAIQVTCGVESWSVEVEESMFFYGLDMKSGLYRIQPEAGEVLFIQKDGYFAFTPGSYFVPDPTRSLFLESQ